MPIDVEVLAEGYQLVEGPRVDDRGGVYFTDVLGGGILRWSEHDRDIETIVPKRKGVGGLALHADGGVVVSGRDIVHVTAAGENRPLFDVDGVYGFNDICATSDGTLLVGGLRFRPFGGEEPVPGAFWHVTAPGAAEVALDDVDWTNGVGDDGRGRWAFCDYHRGTVTFVAGGDRQRVELDGGEADGLAFDDDGGAWIAQPRRHRLVRVTSEGEIDRVVDLPDHQPASLAFDGHGATFVATIASADRTGMLLRVDLGVSGPRHHLATI